MPAFCPVAPGILTFCGCLEDCSLSQLVWLPVCFLASLCTPRLLHFHTAPATRPTILQCQCCCLGSHGSPAVQSASVVQGSFCVSALLWRHCLGILGGWLVDCRPLGRLILGCGVGRVVSVRRTSIGLRLGMFERCARCPVPLHTPSPAPATRCAMPCCVCWWCCVALLYSYRLGASGRSHGLRPSAGHLQDSGMWGGWECGAMLRALCAQRRFRIVPQSRCALQAIAFAA
jgi:hypothetical protein